MCNHTPTFSELLADSPNNWGRWGEDDEVGALNFLDAQQIQAGAAAIESGQSFTLGINIGEPGGDPVWPGRQQTQRYNVMDRSFFAAGKGPDLPGKPEYSDDIIVMALQATTQVDALGHAWHGDQIYNGYPAEVTIGSTSKASILPIAQRGIVGRAVLIDMAGYRGKDVLDSGETFSHLDVEAAAKAQGVDISPRDILVIRTGWIGGYRRGNAQAVNQFEQQPFLEPGLTYSPELVMWFKEKEIPVLATDTIANEVTLDPTTGTSLPLHQALMRNLGVVFSEILDLEDLAAACRADNRWKFMFSAAPLKIVGGTGAPVNPVAIR